MVSTVSFRPSPKAESASGASEKSDGASDIKTEDIKGKSRESTLGDDYLPRYSTSGVVRPEPFLAIDIPAPPVIDFSPPPSPPAEPPAAAGAVNYVSLYKQNNAVSGTFTIDPAISIPASLLPPLPAGENEGERKNLRLESRNGAATADVYLAHNEPGQAIDRGRRRTTLALLSQNGSVTAKVHALSATRLPFHLTVASHNGGILVHLPRSFAGLIHIDAHNGHVSLSDAVSQGSRHISTVNSMRKYLLGDPSMPGGKEAWEGDELSVEAHNGRVKIAFDDETDTSKGFLGRIFEH